MFYDRLSIRILQKNNFKATIESLVGVAHFLYCVVTLLNKATLLVITVQVANSGNVIILSSPEHCITNALLCYALLITSNASIIALPVKSNESVTALSVTTNESVVALHVTRNATTLPAF